MDATVQYRPHVTGTGGSRYLTEPSRQATAIPDVQVCPKHILTTEGELLATALSGRYAGVLPAPQPLPVPREPTGSVLLWKYTHPAENGL